MGPATGRSAAKPGPHHSSAARPTSVQGPPCLSQVPSLGHNSSQPFGNLGRHLQTSKEKERQEGLYFLNLLLTKGKGEVRGYKIGLNKIGTKAAIFFVFICVWAKPPNFSQLSKIFHNFFYFVTDEMAFPNGIYSRLENEDFCVVNS